MTALFWLLAFIVLSSGVAVVSLRSPLNSALALALNLLAVAGLFAMLQAHFLALAQVIVYAGAIVVLVLIALLLLSSKIEQHKRREDYLAVAAIVLGSLFLVVLFPLLQGALPQISANNVQVTAGTVAEIGRLLFTDYVFLFQLAGLLILTALCGAVMLARSRPGQGG